MQLEQLNGIAPGGGLCDQCHIGLAFDHRSQSFAEDGVVVYDQNSYCLWFSCHVCELHIRLHT